MGHFPRVIGLQESNNNQYKSEVSRMGTYHYRSTHGTNNPTALAVFGIILMICGLVLLFFAIREINAVNWVFVEYRTKSSCVGSGKSKNCQQTYIYDYQGQTYRSSVQTYDLREEKKGEFWIDADSPMRFNHSIYGATYIDSVIFGIGLLFLILALKIKRKQD